MRFKTLAIASTLAAALAVPALAQAQTEIQW